jgi:hypothetical protein
MSKVKFGPESLPQSSEELRQILRHGLEQATPMDDFAQMVRDLAHYELRYGMDSDRFLARFVAGELGDTIEFVRWANAYEIYQETKAELDQMVELVEAFALPVMA